MNQRITTGLKELALGENLHSTFLKSQDSINNDNRSPLEYYGENTFYFSEAKDIPEDIKLLLQEVIEGKRDLKREYVSILLDSLVKWAISKGATHFCHWFQPLTGGTAEKHDAFLDFDFENSGAVIEKLSVSQLLQGEPDASSFPNGGSRSTFEARGYTSLDLSSPMFLMEGVSSSTLCIPTSFVSYHGDSLDIKTPLLRSSNKLSESVTRFMNLIGHKDVNRIEVTCGAEQEYFLIDKHFYYARPDLVLTGRTLLGALPAKNQQLDDHYFASIPSRVLTFMEELDFQLHRLGVPAKTRHNEVAPGQFELAQIFREGNISSDNNQLVMSVIDKVAKKHGLIALLHEKPFAGVNGSGKHLNWSMSTNTGINLLDPGDSLQDNYTFMAILASIIKAVDKHSKIMRASIASHSNDHRLGANEAPPSILSVFTGRAIEDALIAIKKGQVGKATEDGVINLEANSLATLKKDNTDRNRTSPFAFTSNKFEFRAVGSKQAIGFPLSILNAAVSDIFAESNLFLEKGISEGKDVDDLLVELTRNYLESSERIIFNGDGYSEEWLHEAERRGLPNLKTTADALPLLLDKDEIKFLIDLGIFKESELELRFNALIEKYITSREIEFNALLDLVAQYVIPSAFEYKTSLLNIATAQKNLELESSVELGIIKKMNGSLKELCVEVDNLKIKMKSISENEILRAKEISSTLVPISEKIAALSVEIELIVPDNMWSLPKYFEMLFIK